MKRFIVCVLLIASLAGVCHAAETVYPVSPDLFSLQVGSAVLRLHLFAALDNTAAPVPQSSPDYAPPVPLPDQEPFPPEQPPFSQASISFPAEQNAFPSDPSLQPEPYFAARPGPLQPPDSAPLPETEPEPRPEAAPRLRRSDRWKEDLGE